MESPVVVDKPPEYHGRDERGFPFDEEEGSAGAGAWSELAARHPDIAARLRSHPAAWPRKRRPDSQDTEDFGDSFGFDRFPFDDIPPEFREHFPSHWNRRFGREEVPQTSQANQPQNPQSPTQQTTSTQTEYEPPPQTQSLPQYGLRNTVDLGQKSAVDPSVVDAEERGQRSMSAPPEGHTPKMSHQEPHSDQPQTGKVRHIPIHVEGRDVPVINSDRTDGGSKPGYSHPHAHSPPEPTYFPENTHYVPPSNFSHAFGGPYKYRQGQPFAQQKMYPQGSAFARGASPQRSQSPKPHEDFIEVPVHHEKGGKAQPKPQPKPQQQQKPQPQQQKPQPQQQQHPQQKPQQQHPQQHQQPPPTQQQQQQQPPPRQPTPPPANDPITQILAIQTDVLKLMTEVENFTGTKKDKRYLFLDEMLTRNLIKLDDIETGGKENIRNARKEAIKCIQKCIAVLEAKAEKGTIAAQTEENKGKDVEMNTEEQKEEKTKENGESEMTEESKESQPEQSEEKPAEPTNTEPQANDTRPTNTENKEKEKPDVDKKTKTNKRDKSKDKAPKNEGKETVQPMQVDDKVEKSEGQAMEVDGAASQ